MRTKSRRVRDSILTTAAPESALTRVDHGPAITQEKSRMLTPASGRGVRPVADKPAPTDASAATAFATLRAGQPAPAASSAGAGLRNAIGFAPKRANAPGMVISP